MTIRFIDDPTFDFTSKRVFCRLDLNVPLDDSGAILDDSRILASLPTVQFLLEKKARIIIASHLGRPKGKVKKNLSIAPVAERLQELLHQEIVLAEDCVGDGVKRLSMDLPDSGILILENLRFYAGEEKNDDTFGRMLAQLGDIYVSDAFGAAHRAHASTAGMVAHFSEKAGGFLLRKEIEGLQRLVRNPAHPFVAVLGGAKVSDKIGVVTHLLNRVDRLIIGGAMAHTFLKAKGERVGASRVEDDRIAIAQGVLNKAAQLGVEISLPVDHVVAKSFDANAENRVIESNQFDDDDIGLDIGPKTRKLFASQIPEKGTIFWNGPMGVFEWQNFSEGTFAVMKAVADSGAYRVVGGGDSVAALKGAGLSDRISHISTGGGASLEFIEGRELPGLKALGFESL